MFSTLKLRREIAVLMDENERLRNELREEKYTSEKHRQCRKLLSDELESTNRNLENTTQALGVAEIKLRKQNEADLMLESVKIIVSLLKGKKEKDVAKSVEAQNTTLSKLLQDNAPMHEAIAQREWGKMPDPLAPYRNMGMGLK